MAQITKTVNKTTVNGSEIFIYTINAAYSGLTQPAQEGKIIDFFPSKIQFILPPIGGQIKSITSTPVSGGTEVSFNLGSVTAGTSLSFTIACSFGPGRVDNDSFTNTANLIADGVVVAQGSAPTVNLNLDENFVLTKFAQPSNIVNPGDEITFILSLTNNNDPGASITNVTITDVLPSELTPVTTFIPIGNDVPSGGYSDPSANGLTGSWSGKTLTFNLPKYNGARYDVMFKATVSSTVTPGQKFVNTGKWTINGTSRNDALLTLSVYDPSAAGFDFYKFGTRTTVVGGPIDWQIVNTNTGNVTLSNYILEDFIPNEVDISSFRLDASTGLVNYSIYIALASNPSNYIPVIQNIANGPYPLTDLTPFIPLGDRIAKIKLTAQNLNVANSGHNLIINGITNSSAIMGSQFTNRAVATSGNISKTALWDTNVNGASDLRVVKGFSPSQPAYYPLEEFEVIITGDAANTITIEPIFADLMPTGLRYVKDSEYFIYYDIVTGKSYDSRQPGFPIPLPTRDIITNFAGTGQTLLRWSFFNFILPTSSGISVVFKAFVEINPPTSFTNKVWEGMPGNIALFVYNEVNDPLDVDADGLTLTDRLSYAEAQGVVLTTSEFSLKKLVKGEKDLDYTNSGLTVQGGKINYKLQVTNNQPIDLKDIEVVDILPYVGDTGVILTSSPRGSQFDVYATSIITAEIVNVIGDPVDPNPEIIIQYSTSTDPKRFDELGNPIGTGDWTSVPPSDITTLRSVRVTTGANVILKPYDRLIVSLGAKAPVGVAIGKIAYNSYAVRANKIVSGTLEPLLPTEPNKVSVTIIGNTLGSIGDFVWLDLNQNGIYDSTEPGVNGIIVELYSDTGVLLQKTVTANNNNGKPGFYLFTDLIDGIYQVKFTPSSDYTLTQQKSGEINGSMPDPITGYTAYITMSNSQQILNIDAGVITNNLASIGDFVWNDLDENGIYDQGEPGINGVTVELYSDNGTLLSTTITTNDSNGNPGYYIFNGLSSGNYKIKFIPYGDFLLTQQKVIEPNGSRPNPNTGLTNIIILGKNEIKTDIDAGIYEKKCTPPVINATNKCIHVGDVFDPMNGVTATDCNGNDITSSIVVTDNTVDTSKPGIYNVSYSVTDKKGQTTIKTIYVKVCKNDERHQAISDIFESVALEQTALAHILNAEGEKIQKGKELNLSSAEMIKINKSVEDMTNTVIQLEMVLEGKLRLFKDVICKGDCCDDN
ncbi:SdrD B-like domain-containing protein [Clostridium sp.]|uniref:SdrD B-like domain-containing protein n=1 Tax=Clostridium sp. TaxID=1506 RepID=UPI003F2A4955